MPNHRRAAQPPARSREQATSLWTVDKLRAVRSGGWTSARASFEAARRVALAIADAPTHPGHEPVFVGMGGDAEHGRVLAVDCACGRQWYGPTHDVQLAWIDHRQDVQRGHRAPEDPAPTS